MKGQPGRDGPVVSKPKRGLAWVGEHGTRGSKAGPPSQLLGKSPLKK